MTRYPIIVNGCLRINPARIGCALGATAALLVCASIAGQILIHAGADERVAAIAHFFYVDTEKNAPTGFSVLMLLFASQLLLLQAVLAHKTRPGWTGHWVVLGIGMAVMAADEALMLHERLIPHMRVLLGQERLGALYFAWVIPASALVLVLGVLFLRFLIDLPPRTRSRLMLAASIYLGGAMGMELLGGQYAEMHGTQTIPYALLASLEEAMEMAGIIVCVWALLGHLADEYGEVRFCLTDEADPGLL